MAITQLEAGSAGYENVKKLWTFFVREGGEGGGGGSAPFYGFLAVHNSSLGTLSLGPSDQTNNQSLHNTTE